MTVDPNIIHPGKDDSFVFPEEGSDMTDTTQDLMKAFAAWAKERFDEVGAAGVAVKHMTVDKIVEEFNREQAVRKDLESKAKD